jgi:hypothetical protein
MVDVRRPGCGLLFCVASGGHAAACGLPHGPDAKSAGPSPVAPVAPVAHRKLRELGALAARAGRTDDDRCRASCVDWYGNARPLFVDGRVMALMGYEIVEGKLEGSRLDVARRASFAPR